MDNKALTFGEKAVGKSFNPSSFTNVDRVKTLHAELIDLLEESFQEKLGNRVQATWIENV